MSRPLRVHHVGPAAAADPDLLTTSQMWVRLTSATLTPASRREPAMASVMNGSVPRRK